MFPNVNFFCVQYTLKYLWHTCDDIQLYILFWKPSYVLHSKMFMRYMWWPTILCIIFNTHLNYFYFSKLLHFKISMMYMWRISILCYFKLFNMWYLKQLYNYFTIFKIYILFLFIYCACQKGWFHTSYFIRGFHFLRCLQKTISSLCIFSFYSVWLIFRFWGV